MDKKRDSVLPLEVVSLRGEIEAWRRSRVPGRSMPEALWREAGKLAGAHGVTQISLWLDLKSSAVRAHLPAARQEGGTEHLQQGGYAVVEPQSAAVVAADVAALASRIEDWRRTRAKQEPSAARSRAAPAAVGGGRVPEPMPRELWERAVRLARDHGAMPIARALRVDDKRLRSLLRAGAESPAPTPTSPPFVEVCFAAPDAFICVVEMARQDGAAMTIRLSRDCAAALGALSEVFWGAGR
ncbi:MAG: hypothetical protein HYV63_33235 [Candidatus Schekmanbacteria bacterium]|nr:hypothetical protein [Candidatus Schekmanbacteria bacterium]